MKIHKGLYYFGRFFFLYLNLIMDSDIHQNNKRINNLTRGTRQCLPHSIPIDL